MVRQGLINVELRDEKRSDRSSMEKESEQVKVEAKADHEPNKEKMYTNAEADTHLARGDHLVPER